MTDGFPDLLSLLEIRIITEFIYGLKQGFENSFHVWCTVQILQRSYQCGRVLRIWKVVDSDCHPGVVLTIYVHVFFPSCLPDICYLEQRHVSVLPQYFGIHVYSYQPTLYSISR